MFLFYAACAFAADWSDSIYRDLGYEKNLQVELNKYNKDAERYPSTITDTFQGLIKKKLTAGQLDMLYKNGFKNPQLFTDSGHATARISEIVAEVAEENLSVEAAKRIVHECVMRCEKRPPAGEVSRVYAEIENTAKKVAGAKEAQRRYEKRKESLEELPIIPQYADCPEGEVPFKCSSGPHGTKLHCACVKPGAGRESRK
ncbi:hypothetical protein [Parelusimicrobium proximum]|uniref:hypothetical protein n=1 Tax=Parelusimicrobium proximum TaxID=3228953 RepID=UPI003D1847EC